MDMLGNHMDNMDNNDDTNRNGHRNSEFTH